jgi:hypothetical protein
VGYGTAGDKEAMEANWMLSRSRREASKEIMISLGEGAILPMHMMLTPRWSVVGTPSHTLAEYHVGMSISTPWGFFNGMNLPFPFGRI